MTETNHDIKERMRVFRAFHHLTQKDLADATGITPGFISQIETGRSRIPDDFIERLCRIYSLRREWLISGIGPRKEDGLDDKPADPSDSIKQTQGEHEAEPRRDDTAGRIALVRQLQRLNQEEFGKRIGYSRTLIAKVEQGACPASDKLLRKIEEAYDVSHDWLVSGSGKMHSSLSGEADKENGNDTYPKYCGECEGLLTDGLTFECLEYTFPDVVMFPAYPGIPEQTRRKGYLIINHIPCRRCETCGGIYYSEKTKKKIGQMVEDLFPVIGNGHRFESPARPGQSVGDTIIQSFS